MSLPPSVARVAVLFLLAGAGPLAALSHLEIRDGAPVVLPQERTPEVFPGAEWRSIRIDGAPVLEARRNGERVGTLFLTHQLDDMVAYSGKPLEILVALGADGVIAHAELIDHHEPILLVGIPEQVLHDFIAQFPGQSIVRLLHDNAAGTSRISLDGVSGATVTGLVADQVILTAGRIVGQASGLVEADGTSKAHLSDDYTPMTWAELVEAGLLEHATLSAAEVHGETAGAEGSEADAPDWLDLYVGVLNQPTLGINLMGEAAYRSLMEDHDGQPLLILLNRGSYSFRGSGFVRGGIFDRLQVTQGLQIIRFRDSDYVYQFHLDLASAPHIGEKAIFVVRNEAFNPARPFELEVLVSERGYQTAKAKTFQRFQVAYEMPADYVEGEDLASGPSGAPPSMVARVWSGKAVWIGLYIALWALVFLVFINRRRVSHNERFLERLHLGILACSILLLGIGQKGQPSVVNIFTFVDVLRSDSDVSLFLAEPFLFVSWIAITVGTLLWGRGPFCGWICPYGGMLELLHWARNKVLPRRWRGFYELPDRWHHRLKYLPYLIFVGLLTISLFSLNLAEMLAEVEPFKTTWLVGVTNRPWYIALYWSWLLIMGLVTVRFFCRYLCPLGGYLAILSRFQIFRLPRRNFCATCNICAKGCSTRAIDAQGHIDSKTCFGCLECTNKMYDPQVCPPLRRPELWDKHEEGRRVPA